MPADIRGAQFYLSPDHADRYTKSFWPDFGNQGRPRRITMIAYARRYSILIAPSTIAAAEAAGISRLEMLWRVANRVSQPILNFLYCDAVEDEIEVEVGVSATTSPTLEISGKPAGALPSPLATLVAAAIRAELSAGSNKPPAYQRANHYEQRQVL